MNANILPSDRAPIMGVIDPDAYGAGTVTTAWVSMNDFANAMAIVSVGTMATNSTLNAKIQQATDSSGTGVKDVTGKAITELTAAGTDSDKQVVINISENDLDIDGDFNHIRLSMTVATAASDSGGVLLGFDAAYAPEDDLSSVDEIV